jgi:hypothetical protein
MVMVMVCAVGNTIVHTIVMLLIVVTTVGMDIIFTVVAVDTELLSCNIN